MKTIKIFISSTFRDMNAERDVIMKNVMPRLRELAEKELGLHVQEVDLRWGVTEEQARRGEVETLCLEGIEECRPYFLCLLGGRYGWIPAPIHLRVADYQAVMHHPALTDDEKNTVALHYHKTDDEQRVYTLDARLAEIDPKEAGEIQDRLQQILERAGIDGAGESITHKEINYSGLKEELPRFIKELDKRLLSLPDSSKLTDYESTLLRSLYIRSSGDPVWRLLSGVTAVEKSRLLPILKKAGLAIIMHRFYFIRNDSTPGFYEIDNHRDTKFYTDPTSLSGNKLIALKTAIRSSKNNDLCEDYPCTWTADNYGREDQGLYPITELNEFEELIFKALWGHIQTNQELREQEAEEKDEVAQELDFHYRYIDSRTYNFCGRQELVAEFAKGVQNALAGNLKVASAHSTEKVPTQIVMVVGEPGSGKSALLGKFFLDCKASHSDHLVIPWFIGASRQSTSPYYILKYWCKILIKEFQIVETEIPDNINKLATFFEICLGKATRPVVIVLDAINQLNKSDNSRTMQWLATKIPQNVCIVTSLVEDKREKVGHQIEEDTTALTNMRRRSPKPFEIAVSKLSEKDKKDIVTLYLKQYYKSLSPKMLDILVNKEESHNPLYLQVALEELRLFSRHEELEAFIANTNPVKSGLPGNAEEMFAFLLTRIEHDLQRRHGDELAGLFADFMRYVAVGRNGMSEEDLRLLLGDWKSVKEHGKEAVVLSPYLWGELRRWIRGYLVQRGEEYDFFHLQLKQAVGKKWLQVSKLAGLQVEEKGNGLKVEGLSGLKGEDKEFRVEKVPGSELAGSGLKAKEEEKNNKTVTEVHKTIAEYLTVMGYEHVTTLRDLPYHHITAGQAEQAAEVMTEFGYHYKRLEKLGADNVVDVTKDFAELVRATLPANSRETVETWQRFHGEIAHLLQRPGISPAAEFMQKANAHADRSPITQSAEMWLGAHGSNRWWFRKLVRPALSMFNPCLRVMEGHRSINNRLDTASIESLALHQDGRRVVSASDVDDRVLVWDIRSGECLMKLGGHTEGVSSLVLHPDGRRVLTTSAGKGRGVRVWDLGTGECLRTFEGEGASVALHPDGRRVLTRQDGCIVRVWDLDSGECLRTIDGHARTRTEWAIHPDGRRFLTVQLGGPVGVWDLDTGECVNMFGGHKELTWLVALHPDGRRAITAGGTSSFPQARVWDLDTGECLIILEGSSVRLHPDGRRALTASKDYSVLVWDLDTGECLRVLEGHGPGELSLILHPDGRRAVSVNRIGNWDGDHTVRVWDLDTGECLHILSHPSQVRWVGFLGHDCRAATDCEGARLIWDLDTGACRNTLHLEKATASVVLHPDGRLAVTGGWDGTVRVWDLEIGTGRTTPACHTKTVRSVTVLADGCVATCGWDDAVRVWDPEVCTCKHMLRPEHVYVLALHTDGRRAVTGGPDIDPTVREWDFETGTCLSTLEGHSGCVESLALHPDGRRIASGGRDGIVRLWDLKTGRCLTILSGHHHEASEMVFSKNGTLTVCADTSRDVRFWNIESGKCVRVLPWGGKLEKIHLHPDGQRAVFVDQFKGAAVYDLDSGECLKELGGMGIRPSAYGMGITSLAFQADGRRFVMGSGDCRVRVCDLDTGQCLRTLEGHTAAVNSVVVHPYGWLAASISSDDTIRLWNIETGDCLGTLIGTSRFSALALLPVPQGSRNRLVAGCSDGSVHFFELMPPNK